MIQKLRRKFVLVLMSVVTVFLAALLTGMYASNAAHYRQASLDALHSAIVEGERARGSMPMTVVETSHNGQLRVLLNQIYFMTDAQIADAVTQVRSIGTESGVLPAQNLRYRCEAFGPGRMRYAFADTYAETLSLRAQAVNSAIIGAIAFLGLLVFSIMLSKWMVRPVQEAWTRQRQFVADASHELKTPLTVALSNVDMVLSQPGPGTEKNRRRLDIAKIELLHMKDLVEKLLALARADVDDRQAPVRPLTPVNLSYLWTCCVSSFEPVFFEAGRQLTSEIDPGCHVPGDERKLSELASILLDNACKYSFPGSIVRISLRHGGKNRVHLTVENQGEAIPPEALERIFDRFFRIDPSRGEVFGYGLGLSIAKEIVSLHRGKIWAESSGTHTAFHVVLPAVSPGQAETQKS